MKPTIDEVMTWARASDLFPLGDWWFDLTSKTGHDVSTEGLACLAYFAYAAGAEAMKERAAKVCDEKVAAEYATGKVDHNEMGWTQACAIAIRALGDDDE